MKGSKAPAYLAFEKRGFFQRPSEMNIIHYLNEFESLSYDIQSYNMTLSSAVLIYCVLKSSDLSNEKRQLVRVTMTKLTYGNMKKQMKAIHGSSVVAVSDWFEIKSESTCLTESN